MVLLIFQAKKVCIYLHFALLKQVLKWQLQKTKLLQTVNRLIFVNLNEQISYNEASNTHRQIWNLQKIQTY